MKILVTGANGFLGKRICESALKNGIFVVAITRSVIDSNFFDNKFNGNLKIICGIDLGEKFDISDILVDIDIVIHTAAVVHFGFNEFHSLPYDSSIYKKVNVYGTCRLAKQSSIVGVKRFIYISTIKVHGENTIKYLPFTCDSIFNPADYYSRSKYEAELLLKNISLKSNMNYVIIRPPLIYGYEAKGNFNKILKIIKLNIPLPLGNIDNLRSFVSVDNLIDLIFTCLVKNTAINQTFLVSDDNDISTSDLLHNIATVLNRKIFLIYLPVFVQKIIFIFFFNSKIYNRLFSNLQVDINKTKFLLNWSPPFTMIESLNNYFKQVKK